jgi:hypothetical protein
VGAVLAQLSASTPRPDVVHFAETVLSGYFVEGGVREVAVTAGTLASDLDRSYRAHEGAGGRPIDVVIGFYERWRETLHNSAAYVRLGDGAPKILHVHRKTFLPTYGLFDEERFVERGHDFRAFDTPWGRAAMLVCEDAWQSLSGTIVWEYWNGSDWVGMALVKDDTAAFTQDGHVRVQLPPSSNVVAATMGVKTDVARYWIRARLVQSNYQLPPKLLAIRTNTA